VGDSERTWRKAFKLKFSLGEGLGTGGAAIVAGGGAGFDLVRSLAHENNPLDFFVLGGVKEEEEDGGALCISFRATTEGVSKPD
jgi:hypothetical protein